MFSNNIDYRKLAEKSILNYLEKEFTIEFIQHSETITYKVCDKDKRKFLLKIYYPKHIGFTDCRYNENMLLSELEWLLALDKETDLVVPKPIKNKFGKLITKIIISPEIEVNCVLYTWIQGDTYRNKSQINNITTYNTGVVHAKMHNQSMNWKKPRNFIRPLVDEHLLTSYISNMLTGINSFLITRTMYTTFLNTIEQTINKSIFKSDKRNYGIMHSDVHRGNIIINDGEIRLIDFSLCKVGNFNWDIAIALANIPIKYFDDFFEGYKSIRSLSKNYKPEIEMFFLASVIGSISFMVHNDKSKKWLENNIERINNYCIKFLNNEEFLFKLREW